MSIFSKRFLIIIIIIFLVIVLSIVNYKLNISQKKENIDISNNEINIVEENIVISNEINEVKDEEKEYNWYVEIKSIDLKAPILETTQMDILEEHVGHFVETSLTIGNIGLAGHNKGYKKNYFENLENVKKGDIITYKYNDFINDYIVNEIEIIKNTNWDYLENTKENKITLITCIENKPEYRLCVQASEKN